MKDTKGTFSPYDRQIHRFGMISSIICILLLAGVPLTIQIVTGATPDFSKVLGAMAGALTVFAPVAIIEFLSYTPIMGAGGMYMSFITGNVMNMKLPAAQSGQKLAEVQPGSKEADVVSVISIGISSLTTTVILLLGMVLAVQLLPLLSSKSLAPAFNNIMPAIMGALLVPRFKSDWVLASVPCLLAVIATLVLGYGTVTRMQTYLLPIWLVISALWGYYLHRVRQKKSGAAKG